MKTTTIIIYLIVCFAITMASIIRTNEDSNNIDNNYKKYNNNNNIMNRSKRSSFSTIDCLGNFDRAKFAKADRICEECYILYREPSLHKTCREFCFSNDVFKNCIDSLSLSHMKKEYEEIVAELLG
ncbi:crustacean hyperglycemic hormone-like [Dermatophagoides pteronyssinus]|uniref:CHH-like protein n=1 Tax=Dermatophagoides pteronyssinus TaxID=6956 RepID=A0A6P6YFI2_DERPT|nr:CHH-like protein [Dermatophagoides pteronyssinus]